MFCRTYNLFLYGKMIIQVMPTRTTFTHQLRDFLRHAKQPSQRDRLFTQGNDYVNSQT